MRTRRGIKREEKEREGRTRTTITTREWPERGRLKPSRVRRLASWRERCPFWTVTGSVVPVKDLKAIQNGTGHP